MTLGSWDGDILRYLILIGLVLAGISSLLAVTAVDAININTSTQRLKVVQEKFRIDRDVVMTLQGNSIQGNPRSATADTCPGREASPSNPVARNDLDSGNVIYKALLTESSPDEWPAGRIYRVNVYRDNRLVSTLYFKNSNPDDAEVEGVRLRVDMGTDNLDAIETYSTLVTRLNACS